MILFFKYLYTIAIFTISLKSCAVLIVWYEGIFFTVCELIHAPYRAISIQFARSIQVNGMQFGVIIISFFGDISSSLSYYPVLPFVLLCCCCSMGARPTPLLTCTVFQVIFYIDLLYRAYSFIRRFHKTKLKSLSDTNFLCILMFLPKM